MASKAAGAYLRFLREAHRLGRPTVANIIKTSENQIKRIEDGVIDSRGSLWLAFCHAVHGNASDLEKLMNMTDATSSDGQQLAQNWLNAQTNPLTDEECQAMQTCLLNSFKDRPDFELMSTEDVVRWQSSLAMLRRILATLPDHSVE